MDFELFSTKDEALAFIKGFKAADNDRDLTIVTIQQLLTLEWRVDYGPIESGWGQESDY
jgi:hypothetical protein